MRSSPPRPISPMNATPFGIGNSKKLETRGKKKKKSKEKPTKIQNKCKKKIWNINNWKISGKERTAVTVQVDSVDMGCKNYFSKQGA